MIGKSRVSGYDEMESGKEFSRSFLNVFSVFRFGWLQRLDRRAKKKIKSPFHWLQLLMFNSNSICQARSPEIGKEWVAMIRTNNFPYFWLPPPGRLLANGLQIVVVIWLTICFSSVSGPPSDFLLFFFAPMWCEIKEKQFSFQLYRLSRSKNTENCYLYSSFHSGFLSLSSLTLPLLGKLLSGRRGSRGCLRNYFYVAA